MEEQRKIFLSGCLKNNIPETTANKVFDLIEYFSGYGFNKSHSAAYALITYRTAFLKAHYPVEYMASVLTNEIGNNENIVYYIGACQEMGFQILPPDVNESFATFTAVGDKIRFGLAGIKNVGEAAVNQIIEERKKDGAFKSLQDFVMRVPYNALNARLMEALIKSGAFDSLAPSPTPPPALSSLGSHRAQLMQIMPEILEMAVHYQREKNSAQMSLFETGIGSSYQTIPLPTIPPWSEKEMLQYEKQFIGFYVSSHPLNAYLADVRSFANSDTRTLKQKRDREEVRLVGLITSIKPNLDKNGNTYATMTLEDFQGGVRLVLFNRPYEQFKNLLEVDRAFYIRGKLSLARNDPEVLVDEVALPSGARKNLAKAVEFELSPSEVTEAHLEDIRTICRKNKGDLPVWITLHKPGVGTFRMKGGKSLAVSPSDDLIKSAERLPFHHTLTFRTRE